jgi:hypothetical protein
MVTLNARKRTPVSIADSPLSAWRYSVSRNNAPNSP